MFTSLLKICQLNVIVDSCQKYMISCEMFGKEKVVIIFYSSRLNFFPPWQTKTNTLKTRHFFRSTFDCFCKHSSAVYIPPFLVCFASYIIKTFLFWKISEHGFMYCREITHPPSVFYINCGIITKMQIFHKR